MVKKEKIIHLTDFIIVFAGHNEHLKQYLKNFNINYISKLYFIN